MVTLPQVPAAQDNWSSSTYQHNASFVYSSAFTDPVMALLEPIVPGERILDLGCGSGELTEKIHRKVSRDDGISLVVGADSSADMIREADKRGSSGSGPKVSYHVLSGERLNELLPLLKPEAGGGELFDTVFSNAALHWMKQDPALVIRNVASVLKSGGRFVGEFGGYLNMVGVRSALWTALTSRGHDPKSIDPFFFPTPKHYRALLEGAGFEVKTCDLVPRPTPLPTGLRGWLLTFGFAFLDPLKDDEERESVIAEVCDKMKIDLVDEEGQWSCMYVRLRFSAKKI